MTWATITSRGGITTGLLLVWHLLIEKLRGHRTARLQAHQEMAECSRQLRMESGNLYYNYRENANELLDMLVIGDNYAEALNLTRKDLRRIQLVAGPITVHYAEQMHEACTKLIDGENQQSCINEFECAASFYKNAIRRDIGPEPMPGSLEREGSEIGR